MLILAAVLSVVLSPPTQTITLGQTATVTATITIDVPSVYISWSKTTDTSSEFSGRTVALKPKAMGPSHIQPPLPITTQVNGYNQQVTEWTFTKQGNYSFIMTVTAPDGTTASAKATINVKRR